MELDFSRWSLRALFHFRAKVQGQTVRVHRVANPYHAVSILGSGAACRAARELSGVRFLSAEAPRLPLSQCKAANCSCRYRHHEDRRHELRRGADQNAPMRPWDGLERRKRRGGRRSTDP
jgi:hypothetical protein